MYQISYYGYGMSLMTLKLPAETTREEAVAIAKEYKADPHRGFASLNEVTEIEVN